MRKEIIIIIFLERTVALLPVLSVGPVGTGDLKGYIRRACGCSCSWGHRLEDAWEDKEVWGIDSLPEYPVVYRQPSVSMSFAPVVSILVDLKCWGKIHVSI